MFELFLDFSDSCVSAIAPDGELAVEFADGSQAFAPIVEDSEFPSSDDWQSPWDRSSVGDDSPLGLASDLDSEPDEIDELFPDLRPEEVSTDSVLVSSWQPALDQEFQHDAASPYGPWRGVLSNSDFESDGQYDPVHHCQVLGDVASDLGFVQQQTNESCSLLAQEQFVQRHLGVNVSEQELEELAVSWGVYTPEGGTTFPGQDAILDYFNVPHQRFAEADLELLDQFTAKGYDALVGVDPRDFYNDPTIPPGSGHAVAIVGKGIDPDTTETKGYYFTDSNYPNTSRFLSVEDVDACWFRDMIVIPGAEVA